MLKWIDLGEYQADEGGTSDAKVISAEMRVGANVDFTEDLGPITIMAVSVGSYNSSVAIKVSNNGGDDYVTHPQAANITSDDFIELAGTFTHVKVVYTEQTESPEGSLKLYASFNRNF